MLSANRSIVGDLAVKGREIIWNHRLRVDYQTHYSA